ncbi:hypothetical protein V3C99_010786 [Haemonchus contortus]|uniref:Transposase n=1 Tax=Haemonchus contortus TaxID=6289 RepID=A0A7I5E891_HAECO
MLNRSSTHGSPSQLVFTQDRSGVYVDIRFTQRLTRTVSTVFRSPS